MSNNASTPGLSALGPRDQRVSHHILSTLVSQTITAITASALDPIAWISIASGVTTHLFLFRHGEWDTKSPAIVLSYVLAFIIASVLQRTLWHAETSVAAAAAGYHFLGLYASMLLYRAFFHRLCKYPGSFLGRLSNFYVTFLSAKRLHLFLEVQQLHAKYGDIVRLGE
jgi:cytochrome P450 family 628